jgi:targeting protein for Xklp2
MKYRRSVKRRKVTPTQEIEMQEINVGKESVKKQMKENSKKYKTALEGRPIEIQHQNSSTVPDKMVLMTEQRQQQYEQFCKELCERKAKNPKIVKKKKKMVVQTPSKRMELTKPKPFDLQSARRARNDNVKTKDFVSLREQVDRYYENDLRSPSAAYMKKKVTKPISPEFQLKKRLGPAKAQKGKTTEDMEIEEIQMHGQFKAQPINDQILYGSKQIGLPTIQSRPATQFQEFKLHTLERDNSAASANPKIEDQNNTKHYPNTTQLNKSILQAPDFVPEIKGKTSTTITPFVFQTEKRANSISRNVSEERPKAAEQFKALPIPYYPDTISFKKMQKPTPTVPTTFHLHTETRARSETVPEVKEENSKFKAMPMPVFANPQMKRFEHKHTEPIGFQLETDKRTRNTSEVEQPITFQAQPMPDYEKMRVEIKASEKPLTKPQPIQLSSDIRAEKRAVFDDQMKKIMEEKVKMELEMQKQKEKEEEIEISKLRKEAQFTAQPILQGEPIEIKPSTKPLTMPECPKLLTSERSDRKANHDNKENELIQIQ